MVIVVPVVVVAVMVVHKSLDLYVRGHVLESGATSPSFEEGIQASMAKA